MRKNEITFHRISGQEYAAKIATQKMSEGEKVARLYLGKKQMEKQARIDAAFLIVWAFLILAVLTAPAWLFGGF